MAAVLDRSIVSYPSSENDDDVQCNYEPGSSNPAAVDSFNLYGDTDSDNSDENMDTEFQKNNLISSDSEGGEEAVLENSIADPVEVLSSTVKKDACSGEIQFM